MQKKLVVGNMKMNPVSVVEFDRYLDILEKELKGKKLEKTEIVICPPAVYFERALKRKMDNVKVGAQNIFWESKGAFTGEISAGMIKSMGVQYSLVGHSERKKYFGEDDNMVNLKLKSILKSGLAAILCIGESADERKRGQTSVVIKKQVKESLADISAVKLENIALVYEPVWAVGSDEVPSPDDILQAKIIMRKMMTEMYSARVAEKMKILYGGSINSRCVQKVCVEPAMDGGLVGRESLVPYELVKISQFIDEN